MYHFLSRGVRLLPGGCFWPWILPPRSLGGVQQVEGDASRRKRGGPAAGVGIKGEGARVTPVVHVVGHLLPLALLTKSGRSFLFFFFFPFSFVLLLMFWGKKNINTPKVVGGCKVEGLKKERVESGATISPCRQNEGDKKGSREIWRGTLRAEVCTDMMRKASSTYKEGQYVSGFIKTGSVQCCRLSPHT